MCEKDALAVHRERMRRATDLIAHYATLLPARGGDEDSVRFYLLVDLFSDLRHYCWQHNVSNNLVTCDADQNFNAEVDALWDYMEFNAEVDALWDYMEPEKALLRPHAPNKGDLEMADTELKEVFINGVVYVPKETPKDEGKIKKTPKTPSPKFKVGDLVAVGPEPSHSVRFIVSMEHRESEGWILDLVYVDGMPHFSRCYETTCRYVTYRDFLAFLHQMQFPVICLRALATLGRLQYGKSSG